MSRLIKQFHLNEINPYIICFVNVNAANCPPAGKPYPPRTTRWYELELVTWGNGIMVTEGERQQATNGALFFRPPGVKVQGIAPYFCYFVVFDMVYDPSKKLIYENQSSPCNMTEDTAVNNSVNWEEAFATHLDIRNSPEWESLFKALFDEYVSSGTNNQFTLKTLLIQLLHKLYKQREDEALLAIRHHSSRRHLHGILAAKAYIDQHPASIFTLEELSARAGLSKNFFCTTFKAIVGESPIVYGNRMKINTAKTMLIQTNDSIKMISFAIGIDNVSYFHRLFKSLEGVSPLQYRERAHMQLTRNTFL